MTENRQELNRNLAQMLKGGVIMDVTTPEQAKIAEAAGACAVMALVRIPADIRAAGGVSRQTDQYFTCRARRFLSGAGGIAIINGRARHGRCAGNH